MPLWYPKYPAEQISRPTGTRSVPCASELVQTAFWSLHSSVVGKDGLSFGVTEELPARLPGCFRHNGKYEVPNRFEVGANNGVVQVSRGVLNLESVP
jgi:hypothetical protein